MCTPTQRVGTQIEEQKAEGGRRPETPKLYRPKEETGRSPPEEPKRGGGGRRTFR